MEKTQEQIELTASMKEAERLAHEKMGKAKAKLIIDQPFFASIICTMPISADWRLPTMGTNGNWVRYNPDFVNQMSMDETKFVLCHEVMHCVYSHMFRRGERDPWKWNVAGDYIINDLLVQEKVGTMPSMGLLDHNLAKQAEYLTENLYDLLPENPNGDGGYDGQGGNPLDQVMEGDDGNGEHQSESERTMAENDMKIRVAQAAQAAKMCGKMSANIERLVDQCLAPKVDWRAVLRRFVSSRAKVDYSWARPKRRFAAEDIYLPSLGGHAMGPIMICVDCSGSIGEAELAEFAAEIKAIKEDMNPTAIHLLYFDSEVCHYEEFAQDEELHIEPHGGGGTAFSPCFHYAADRDIDPVCCVFLTDLYCSDFGPPPHYPTLWVTTAATEAPWGEVVLMKNTR